MVSIQVECAVKERHNVAEGPVWEEKCGTLLFVDITGKKVCRWSPETNVVQSISTETCVSAALPRASGGYVLAGGARFDALDWERKTITPITQLKLNPKTHFNDGKVDPGGRFFIGTMPMEIDLAGMERKLGSLYTLNPDHTVVKHFDQVDISNGLDWSLDHKIFYYIDSLSYKVDAFDYDITTGSISNRRMVYQLEKDEGIPDGMCIDVEGRLWVACYSAGRVLRIDPQTGTRVNSVKLPVDRVTSCCFGGKHYSDLYVTTANLGMDEAALAKQPQSGCIFKVSGLGVKGIPPVPFAG